MQSNPPTNSNKKTLLTLAVIFLPIAFVGIVVIFMIGMVYSWIPEPAYKTQTAKAQPEIIKIEPTTWSESDTAGPGRSTQLTHQVNGYRVTYKFTTASGETVSQVDPRQRWNDPSNLAQVCYDPKKPANAGLYPAGKCF